VSSSNFFFTYTSLLWWSRSNSPNFISSLSSIDARRFRFLRSRSPTASLATGYSASFLGETTVSLLALLLMPLLLGRLLRMSMTSSLLGVDPCFLSYVF
jgi:hypothetical protein